MSNSHIGDIGLGNADMAKGRFAASVQPAPIAVTASGYTQLVAAPGAGLKIVVTGLWISTKTANDYFFASASTQLSPTLYMGATSGFIAPNLRQMPLVCAANEAFRINGLAAGTASVLVTYRVVGA